MKVVGCFGVDLDVVAGCFGIFGKGVESFGLAEVFVDELAGEDGG